MNIAAILRIKNNNLYRIRKQKGYTHKQMAAFCNIPHTSYMNLENFKLYPINKDGKWTGTALKVAKKLKLIPEMIFPEEFKFIQKNVIEKELDAAQLLTMKTTVEQIEASNPETQLINQDLHFQLNKILKTLTYREEKIISMRFGLRGEKEHTLQEIAQAFNVTRERILYIEERAFRKLRRPCRNHLIREFY